MIVTKHNYHLRYSKNQKALTITETRTPFPPFCAEDVEYKQHFIWPTLRKHAGMCFPRGLSLPPSINKTLLTFSYDAAKLPTTSHENEKNSLLILSTNLLTWGWGRHIKFLSQFLLLVPDSSSYVLLSRWEPLHLCAGHSTTYAHKSSCRALYSVVAMNP